MNFCHGDHGILQRSDRTFVAWNTYYEYMRVQVHTYICVMK